MTTERSLEDPQRPEDVKTPLAGLPLFVQTVPPVGERNGASRPVGTVAHLTAVSTTPLGGTVDWSLVSALRAQASEQLSQAVAADRGRLDKIAQEEKKLNNNIKLDEAEAGNASTDVDFSG